MQKVFLRNRRGYVIAATKVPFKSEDEFERYVLDAKEILSGIYILGRQVRAGRDILDMIGIDRDGAVVIENKNEEVDEGIIEQILRYAIWAEKHPADIKTLWLEAKDCPRDTLPDWEDLQIRLVVLAPSITPDALHFAKKLNYEVEFIEINKFVVGSHEIILVNHLESAEDEARGVARGMQVHDKEFYKEDHDSHTVDAFFDLAAEVERIVKANGWDLRSNSTGWGLAFKHGRDRAFGIEFWNKTSFGIFLQLSTKGAANRAKKLCPYPSEYDGKFFEFEVTKDMEPKRLTPVLQLAYECLMEKRPEA
ncbi:MAG: hypothetical protein ACLQU3_27035 [Limisphaerales bacterium]